MDALAGLRRQVSTVKSLRSLVRSMRLLSAVNLKMLAKAEAAQRACLSQVETGLGLLLRESPPPEQVEMARLRLVLGSDHGLCGGFHHGLLSFCLELPEHPHLWCVGRRLAQALEERELALGRVVSAPGSEAGIGALVEELGLHLGQTVEAVLWLQGRVERLNLWPPSRAELEGWRSRDWPGRCRPLIWGRSRQLYPALLQEMLRMRCQLACVSSLISENQARLNVMQAAEKNLDSLGENAQSRVRQLQQNMVTEELLDIVSGFEILSSDDHSAKRPKD